MLNWNSIRVCLNAICYALYVRHEMELQSESIGFRLARSNFD